MFAADDAGISAGHPQQFAIVNLDVTDLANLLAGLEVYISKIDAPGFMSSPEVAERTFQEAAELHQRLQAAHAEVIAR